MAVLGVLACEILELEFAHLLASDQDISALTVVEDVHSFAMIEALERNRVDFRRIPMVRSFMPVDPQGFEVLVRILEIALHNRKRRLQDGLLKAAKEMGRYVDAIVLGYGLCGNALQDPESLLADAGVPLFIPMDEDHPVDDCVGLMIGGREIYYGEQCKTAGTFFMIPGWTRHWRNIFAKEHGFDTEFVQRLFRMCGYERSLLIPSPVVPEAEMRRNIKDFNELFNLRTEVRAGTLHILNQAWETAKTSILGSRGPQRADDQ